MKKIAQADNAEAFESREGPNDVGLSYYSWVEKKITTPEERD